MPIRVQLPDGSIGEFPDGMKDSEIEAVLQKQYGTQNDQPAGLPAGVSLPGVTAHPAVNMQEPTRILADSAFGKRLDSNVSGLIDPLKHPINSIMSHPEFADPSNAGDLISDIRQNPNKTGISNALADAVTAAAIGGAMHEAPAILEPLGEGMKSSAAKILDRTAGLRKADVARGAEPGRAYLEAGGGPALSLKGLGEQADSIKEKTGSNLRQVYQDADSRGVKIPVGDVMQTVQEPISKLRRIQNSAGGTGSPASLSDFEDNLYKPIWDASNRGGFTPSELFSEMKQPISQNTRWNDPTMFDLNKVRQETVGRIGSLLTDAVPESGRLNKIYQGTSKLANRAAERGATGQTPLSAIGRHATEAVLGGVMGAATHNPFLAAAPVILDSVPVKTTAAKGLFEGGRIAPKIGAGLRDIAPIASTRNTFGPKENPEKKQK